MVRIVRIVRLRTRQAVVGAASVLLLLALAVAPAAARDRLRPDRVATRIALSTLPRVELRAVSSTELVRGAAIRSVPIGSEQEISDAVVETLTREVPAMWEMSVPAGTEIDSIEVVYDLVSASGRRHRLSADAADVEGVAVQVRPLPSVIVSQDDDRSIVRGGALLELDVRRMRRAGRYNGSLQITVTER